MAIKNNTPRVILNGIKDESVVPLVPEPEQLPIHLPLLYIRAAKGPEEAMLLGSGDGPRIFGDDTFNTRKEYYNHATSLLQTVQAEGNSVFVKRVLPSDATTASVTITATLNKTAGIINEYERTASGVVVEDALGAKQFKSPIVPVPGGISVKYNIVPTASLEVDGIPDFSTVGTGDIVTYPLYTFTASHKGKYGNNIGFRLWTMTSEALTSSADKELIDEQNAQLFMGQLVERVSASTTLVTDDLYGENRHEFMFDPKAYDPDTDLEITIQSLVNNYRDDGKATNSSPVYGPLGELRVHQNNLDEMLEVLLVAENALSPVTEDSSYMLGVFRGLDYELNNYYSFQVDDTGVMFTEGRTHYLTGGSDGTITDARHNEDVGIELDFNYENIKYPLMDTALYPFSALYDSGYPVIIKKKMLKWLGRRKDIHITLATFVDGEAPLTVAQEVSVGTDLRIAGTLYAESDLHGTGVCRLVIMGQSGKFVSNSFKGYVSNVVELAAMRARYLGAGNGRMKSGLRYDAFPANNMSRLKDLSVSYMSSLSKQAVWAAGVNYAQYVDRRTMFFPGLQTVYGIKNSILVSEMLMQIAVDVTKQSDIVWRMLTGTTGLSQAEFIARSNALLSSLVANKYDERVTVEPNTYFTAADTARGYSWTQDVAIYGTNSLHVGTVNVITRRI